MAASLDPVTGPIARDAFAKLVDLPFGKAALEIRKFDPMWGLPPGTTIDWRVECKGNLTGVAYVKAASRKEAENLANDLSDAEVDWDICPDDFEIISIEPDRK